MVLVLLNVYEIKNQDNFMNLNNHSFSSLFKNEKIIENKRVKILNIIVDNDLQTRFIDKINVILSMNPLEFDNSIFLKQIVYNFWNIIYLYDLQINHSHPKCKQTRIAFLNISIRILQFAIFTKHRNLDNIHAIYFNDKNIDLCFYTHFMSIEDEILLSYKDLFDVLHDEKNKNKVTIFIDSDENKYLPISIPKNEIEGKNNLEKPFWFQRFFQLKNEQIKHIFNEIGSKGNSTSSDTRRRNKHKNFDTYNYIDDIIETTINLKELNNLEGTNEFLSKLPVRQSILFTEQNILNIKVDSKHLNSNYKQHLINKAISSVVAKNSMYLYSKAPNLNILKHLVNSLMIDENNYSSCLLLFALFTGISIKDSISIFLHKASNISFYKNSDYILKITHDKNIFAKNVPKDETILIPRNGTVSNVFLPYFLHNICSIIKEEFAKQKLDNSSLDEFIHQEYNKCNITLKNKIKLLQKSIANLNIRNIHKLFYHYFHIYNKKTDTSIIFLTNLSKSNQARVCYTSQPKRLVYYELWIENLYKLLYKKAFNPEHMKDLDMNDFVGSPKVVKCGAFKNFLLDLSSLIPKNYIDEFNLKMIFIRYSLSILLATRYYVNSCDLSDFSRNYKLLTIHEKIKHIKTSKRLIPLTDKALLYIDEFIELKEKYKIDFSYPILLKEENSEITSIQLTKISVLEYLKSFKDDYKYFEIEKFIKITELNLGRHVFSSEALKNGFDKDYENEFMGHFSRGSSGLGVYSNFNINDYINSTRAFIEDIEKRYFPTYITSKDIKCKMD